MLIMKICERIGKEFIMKAISAVCVITAVLLVFASACWSLEPNDPNAPAPEPVRPANGQTAPDFTLKDLAGKKVSLSDFKDQVILLEFWAAWCPPCKAAMPQIQKLYDDLSPKGLKVLCVCTHSKLKELKGFLQNHPEYKMPVLFDPGQQNEAVGFSKYLIDGFPSFFVIGKDGKIVEFFKGFDEQHSPKTLRETVARHGIQ
jgi:peroxiredoxin